MVKLERNQLIFFFNTVARYVSFTPIHRSMETKSLIKRELDNFKTSLKMNIYVPLN